MDKFVDLYSNNLVRRAIDPERGTDNTAIVSQIIDMQGFRGLLFAIAIGTLADADVTVTVLLQESADSGMSGANSVADADMHGTETTAAFTFADDDTTRVLGYRGNKRYVRLTLTPVGNDSGNHDIAAVAIMGGALAVPVSQTEAS